MATATQTAADIQRLVWLFLPLCNDRETLLALDTMAVEPNRWPEGHELFRRIRTKTLAAERAGDCLSNAQYCFEEVCAKTLYNLSGFPAPFDSDAPDWIRPNALALAQALSIPDPDSVVGLGA